MKELRPGSTGSSEVRVLFAFDPQPRVSQIEHGNIDHAEVATLRAYIAALGGRLEVIATFGDERLSLS